MVETKEFLGKTLDAAIMEACNYYGVAREKLEIDIIEDAKTGIFGIVGARKAKIKAKIATLPDFLKTSSETEETPRKRSRRSAEKAAPREEMQKKHAQDEKAEVAGTAPTPPAEAPEGDIPPQDNSVEPPQAAAIQPEPARVDLPQEAPMPESTEALAADAAPRSPAEPEHKPRRERSAKKTSSRQEEELPAKTEEDTFESSFPKVPLLELDREKLFGETRTILGSLAAPVLGLEPDQLELSMEISDDRLLASIQSEDTGLLIGRDGQNLAAIQYIASRILSKNMGSIVRLQVDAGDYHTRQDSRLQELALALAEKVRATGKPQTTRPLSAYQRRVVHLALQNAPDIQTRSSGDGPLKHVVIMKSKD